MHFWILDFLIFKDKNKFSQSLHNVQISNLLLTNFESYLNENFGDNLAENAGDKFSQDMLIWPLQLVVLSIKLQRNNNKLF